MVAKKIAGKLPKGNEIFGNLKNLGIFVLVVVGIVLMLSGSVSAYSAIGGGICNCGNNNITSGGNLTDACADCSAALNDNTNCANQVNYVGIVSINNRTETCIYNPANFTNKIFDCQGHKIDGDDATWGGYAHGIYLEGKSNNTIKNCVLTNFGKGIYLRSSSGNKMSNNTANLNFKFGIGLDSSPGNSIINNTANLNNGVGISFGSSSGNSIINNTANLNNRSGIYLYDSSNNTVINNTAQENEDTDILFDAWTSEWCNNVIENNTGSGNRAIKYFNQSVTLQNEILSELILCDADNSSINNITITGSETKNNNGLFVFHTDNSNFTNINSFGGIKYVRSESTTVAGLDVGSANISFQGKDVTVQNATMPGNEPPSLPSFKSIDKYVTITNTSANSWIFINISYSDSDIVGINESTLKIVRYNGTEWFINQTAYTYTFGINTAENYVYANITNFSTFVVFGKSSSYNIEGNGVCNCSNCNDCNNALNDSANCSNAVKLTADIINQSGTCINSPENFTNKIFDCLGHKIDGDDSGTWQNPSYGIYLGGKQNNTIKNCIITDFYAGIYLDSSTNNTLTSNTANNNNGDGIDLYSSTNNTLTSNTANNNGYGIYLSSSTNNTLTNNTANSNTIRGISLLSSSNNILTNNTANSNSYGIWLWYASNSNTLTNNTANSNKYGIYIFHNSNFNQILSNEISNNKNTGITISNCDPHGYCSDGNSNNTIEDNEISNNNIGIYSKNSDSIINSNYVCGNINLDFDSFDWLSSSGGNNTCDNASNWNDTGAAGCTYSCAPETEVSEIITNKSDYYPGDVVKIEFNITVVDQSGACVLDSVDFSITDGNSLSCSLPNVFGTYTDYNCGGHNINLTVTQKYYDCNQYGGINNTYYYVIFWQIPNNWVGETYTMRVNMSSGGQTDTSETIFNIINPNISLVKIANTTSLPAGGGLVTYYYFVNNTGNVPLSNVTVSDDKCSPVHCPKNNLTAGESMICNCTVTINQTTTNIATATGNYLGTIISATASATVNVVTCVDNDGDGYNITGGSCGPIDCDDTNSTINPNTVWFYDADNDNYGNATNYIINCTKPSGNWVLTSGDCNDTNSTINPNTIWYADNDTDGYGNAAINQTNCTKPSGNWTLIPGDCNDNNLSIHPGTPEIYNGVDDNCVNGIDEGFCNNETHYNSTICTGWSCNTSYYCNPTTHLVQSKKTDDNTCTASYECQNNHCMNDGKCHPASWECVNANAEINATHYCDASHLIQNKKANDNSCSQNYECQNGNCLNNTCKPQSWQCTNNGTSINTTHYCDSNHQIQTKKTNDNTCSQNYECQNSNCMNDGKCHPGSWQCVNANTSINATHYCNTTNQIQSKKQNGGTCDGHYGCVNGDCISGICGGSPDLYVGASMPLSGKQNQEISINLTVKNDAGIYVQELKNVSVLFKVVLNGTIIINETKYINMSNKYFNQLSFSFIPTNFGNYTIEITADSLNVIAESNESNNKISRNISVEEEDYNFRLVVVDNITNEPIGGAIIYVNGTAIGQTKINGIFTYKLQQGEYGIMITKDKYVNYFEKVNISGKTQINAGLYRKVYNLFNPSGYEIFTNTTTVPGYIQNVYCCIEDDWTRWYPDTCTVNISECSCPGGVTNYHCYNTGGLGGLKKIHPNDEQLRKYSYTYPNYFFYNYTIYNNSFLNISNYGFSADKFVPEFSSKYTKEDVSRQMKVISNGYIKNYDYDCTGDCNNIPDNLYKKRKCDGKCEAWHASDYEIINKEEGVCEDWAVLSVSFASSYGLPARYVTVWKQVWNESAQKWQDGGGHALLEVFNATGNGTWIHLDTLWGEFNNPFKYDNSKGWEGEVFRACAYYPNGTLMEDVTWKYSKIHASGNCWNYSGKAYMGTSNISNNADNFTLPQTSESPPGDLPSNFIPGNRTYKITIKTNTTAEFNAIIQLSSIGTDTINVKYNNGTLNYTELKQEIIETIGLENITPTELTINNLNDTSKQVILNANFDIQIMNYTFNHEFITSQFDRLKYIVNSNVDVEFVNPSPDNSENGFAWNFDANNPGSHEIRAYLTKPKTYFVLPSGVSVSKVRQMLADVVANKINGTVITENNITNISNADVTYILGDYFEISSEQERQIQNRSRETYRITGSDVLLSKQLAPMFWQDTSNAVTVHPDNYNEVELAKNYSIQQKSPLILTDKLLNDDTCSQDTECESTHCVHNICRSTSPFCGDNFCDPGENATNCPVDCNKATDIFDAVEMLEYLSENKNLSRNRTYYKFANYDDDVNLPDVFALIENIVTEQ